MNHYKIVYVKNEYLYLFHNYPNIVFDLYNHALNNYETKQRETIFDKMDKKEGYLKTYLMNRDDCTYDQGVYCIHNSITGENIIIKINQYDFEVKEDNDKRVIYGILKNFSKNYYMFSL